MNGAAVETQPMLSAEIVLDDVQIEKRVVVENIGNSKNRTEKQRMEGVSKVTDFMLEIQETSIVAFTDGSVKDGPVGKAACAAVLREPKMKNEVKTC